MRKNDSIVSSMEISEKLHISIVTAQKMIRNGEFGSPINLNRTGRRKHIRIRREDFNAYLAILDKLQPKLPNAS